MALTLKDRVLESSTSTGTGSFTLTGAETGYQSFSVIGNGNTTYYTIQGKNPDGTLTGEWEVGVGTWSTGNTLSRDTVLSNSLGTTAKIVFSAGAKDVFCDLPADKAIVQDATGNASVTGVFTAGSLATNSYTSTTPVLSFNASNSGFASGATIANSYLQTVLQNKSGTSSASTNYVLSNDLGTDSSYYGEFGMNSSVYSSSPTDFFSLNNGVYFSAHDGDVSIGSGNGYKTYFAWGTSGDKAHVINASGAIGLNTNITGTTNFGTAGQVLTSQGNAATPTWTTVSGGGLTINTTTISGGTSGRVLYDNAGTVGELVNTGTGNNVLATNPTMSVTGAGLTLQDATDTTKQANFDLSTLTTGTTYSYKLPVLSGSTLAVLGLAQTWSALQTFSNGLTISAASFNFSSTGSAFSVASQTTGTTTIGGTAQTGTLTFGQSTAAQTVNIATGVTAASTTKAVNIGTAGNATSITNIAIGSTTGTSTTTINGAVTLSADTQAINIGNSQTTGAITIGGSTGSGSISIGTGTQFISLSSGAANAGTQKRVDIANSGSNSGTRLINIARNITGASASSTTINIGDNNAAGACNVNINNTFKQTTIALTTLTSNVTPVTGMRAFLNDYAITPIFNADVTIAGGGGGFATPIWYDGTTWRVG
jgi:hypothetical protein